MEFNSELFEKAVAWAELCSVDILYNGLQLSLQMQCLARNNGVRRPENIRIISVQGTIPRPTDPELLQLMDDYSFLSTDTAGLALGYGIYIRGDAFSNRILSHELRHVYQYEQAGSIRAFLAEYIPQILLCGYRNAALEIDARKYEIA